MWVTIIVFFEHWQWTSFVTSSPSVHKRFLDTGCCTSYRWPGIITISSKLHCYSLTVSKALLLVKKRKHRKRQRGQAEILSKKRKHFHWPALDLIIIGILGAHSSGPGATCPFRHDDLVNTENLVGSRGRVLQSPEFGEVEIKNFLFLSIYY